MDIEKIIQLRRYWCNGFYGRRKGEWDSSITDSYSSPSKGNEFITTFKQDIQGHKKGLNKEEKQNLKDAVKSIYSPRRLADGEAMMCEIQGAQEDFVRRWEMCVPISCIGVNLRKENAQEKLERMKLLIG